MVYDRICFKSPFTKSGKSMIKLNQAKIVFDSRGIAGLHSINLEISKGSIFALMGPNGSGKTTILNVLTKKLPLDSGDLEVPVEPGLF